MTRPRLFRAIPNNPWAWLLVMTCCAVIAQAATVPYWTSRPDYRLLWLPGALLLSLLLVSRRGLWLAQAMGMVFGVVLAGWVYGLPPASVLLVTLPVPVTMLAAAWFVLRRCGHAGKILTELTMAIHFIVAVLLAGIMNGYAIRLLSSFTSFDGVYLGNAWNIAMAHVLGCMLLVPPWLSLMRPESVPHGYRLATEWLLQASGLAIIVLIWWLVGNQPAARALLLLLPVVAIIFAFTRLRLLGASAAVLVLTLAASALARMDHGPFSGLSAGDAVIGVQLWALPMASGLLFLSASYAQRRSARMALAEAHRSLQALAGRLISAQEDERARIARELHDDVGQRVASAAILLSSIRRHHESAREGMLDDLQGQMRALSEDVRNLSHGLHPSTLRHVGLAPALEGLCAMPHGGQVPAIELKTELGADSLPDHIELCIYRVVQEALRNVLSHAHAQHLRIEVSRVGQFLTVEISDDGRGFAVDHAANLTGLGLISMRERVRQEGGEFDITSIRNRGTRICIRLELKQRPRETTA